MNDLSWCVIKGKQKTERYSALHTYQTHENTHGFQLKGDLLKCRIKHLVPNRLSGRGHDNLQMECCGSLPSLWP